MTVHWMQMIVYYLLHLHLWDTVTPGTRAALQHVDIVTVRLSAVTDGGVNCLAFVFLFCTFWIVALFCEIQKMFLEKECTSLK